MLPASILDIILQYKASIEHFDKFQECLFDIKTYATIKQRSRLNVHFHRLFYPGWYADVIMNWHPFPHIPVPPWVWDTDNPNMLEYNSDSDDDYDPNEPVMS